jgi:glutamate transport system substrate-binding protein
MRKGNYMQRRHLLRSMGTAAIAGALLLGVAACGDDDDEGGSAATTAAAGATTTAAAATTAGATTTEASATTTAGGGTSAPAGEAMTCESAEAGGELARLCAADSVTVGVKFDQPLFGLKNPTTNEVEGFDVEIAKIIAEALGKSEDQITFTETVSRVREDVIANGQVDFVVATYTINDERKQKVDFAGPYYVAGQDIMVAADNTDITGKESLDGKTVCTATGSTPERRLREETKAEVVTFDTYSECAEALRDGRVEAVSTDNVILLGLIQDSGDEFKLVGAPFSEEPYGIGLKLGADDLRSFINDVLEQSFEDGTWAAAYEATVGQVDENTPEPPAVDRY